MAYYSKIAQDAPVYTTVTFPTNATIANTRFFSADSAYVVDRVAISHVVAGTDAGAVNVVVRKLTGTEAVTGGTSVTAVVHNLKGAINTTVVPALASNASDRTLAVGDSLGALFSGTTTAVAGVSITVRLKRVRPIAS